MNSLTISYFYIKRIESKTLVKQAVKSFGIIHYETMFALYTRLGYFLKIYIFNEVECYNLQFPYQHILYQCLTMVTLTLHIYC